MRTLALAAAACLAASCGGERTPSVLGQVPRVEAARALVAEDVRLSTYRIELRADGIPRIDGARTTLDKLRRARGDVDHFADEDISGVTPDGPRVPADAELPSRRGQVVGAIFPDAGKNALVLVLAAPSGRAGALIDLLEASGGLIAVAHRGKLRALRVDFGLGRLYPGSRGAWLELRVDRAGIEVEGVPDLPERVPWQSGAVDGAGLERAMAAVKQKRTPLARRGDVDVLVTPDVSVQRLVDVLVQLEAIGVRTVILGHAPPPGSEEALRRGHRIISVRPMQPSAQGDLDKAIIRAVIKDRLPELRACYEDALADNGSLNGTVQTQFFITPNGNVSQANAAGVSSDLAACFARVVKGTIFPKPKGGGGVQVNYPFQLRT